MKKLNGNKLVLRENFIYMLVLGIMVLVSVFYAYKSNLLFCGYYFADDHEIARIHGGIVRDGLWSTMITWIEADTNLRFRPVYWVFRVLESFVCGTRPVLWHFIKACEIGLCAWTGFWFARKMKVSYLVSIIFSAIGFFGTQCAVVYRLGPQEPQALIFMFLALTCAVIYTENNQTLNERKEEKDNARNIRWLIAFHFFLTLMMLTKESFLILVPICVFFVLYLEMQQIYVGEQKLAYAVKKVLKKHVGTILYEAVVFTVCMCVIVFHSGVSSTGYAGLDSSYSAMDYLMGMRNVWTGEIYPYILLMLSALVVNIIVCILNPAGKFIFFRVCEIVMVLYFVLSQSFLHAKTGMSERYVFPCITGILIYVCCFSIPLWMRLLNNRKWKSILIQTPLILWAVWMVMTSQFHALCVNYAYTCSNNTLMLIRLSELAEERGGEDCKIIVSTQFGEWNLAVCAFMEELYGVHQTYALSQNDSDNTIPQDRYVIDDRDVLQVSISEADIYVAQKEFLPIKMRECGVEYTELEQEIFGNYIVFYK